MTKFAGGRLAAAAVALVALPVHAQQLRVDFARVEPVPLSDWLPMLAALVIALLAFRFLGRRARTLMALAAAGAIAAWVAWQSDVIRSADAVIPTVDVPLTSSPAFVSLAEPFSVYRLVNTTSTVIRIQSIDRLNAGDWSFGPAPAPFCDKQQSLVPGQFCNVALGYDP